MISTQVRQALEGFDELIDQNAEDFQRSGLKVVSVIRVSRLAVVSTESLVGAIGEIGFERLERVRQKLSAWIRGT
jgi:mRNA interferase MazF